jgi:dTDP-glucose pyrophosphorylase/CBS domain-containing protein
MSASLPDLCVGPECPIRDAVTLINRNAKGIALVTDADRRLLGTITDGDVRRALMEHLSLDSPVRELLTRKVARYVRPVTAPAGTSEANLLQLMHEHVIHQIPLLDAEGRVTDLVTLDELLGEEGIPMQAVIMAGGFGKRLLPLTEETPKPMLLVGDRPLMERTIEQLREAGIRRVNVTTHYLPEKITDHFGDGTAFGVQLNYVSEETPLGTAGALGLMEAPSEPLLVINGDILTRVNFRAMLGWHREHRADLTVAVRRFSMQVPYGVIDAEGGNVTAVREKPDVHFLVNAGIYLLEPSAYEFIEAGARSDMTDLIHRLLEAKRTVSSFLVHEYWLDIGKHDDYLRAQADASEGTFDL